MLDHKSGEPIRRTLKEPMRKEIWRKKIKKIFPTRNWKTKNSIDIFRICDFLNFPTFFLFGLLFISYSFEDKHALRSYLRQSI